MAQPFLIAVGGLSGSGKTSLAAALQGILPNTVHLDSDRTRKEIFGVAETARLPEEAYSLEATQRVIAEMDRRIKENIAAGKNVIVSAIFNFLEARKDKERLAQVTGARFVGLWLQADKNVLLDRVSKRTNNVSDAGADIVKMQLAGDVGVISWPIIDANQPRGDILRAALGFINAGKEKSQ